MDAPFPVQMLPDIEDFFLTEHHLDGVICPDVFKRPYFFPLQRRGEMRRMLEIAAAREPVVVAEIGADKAGGLLHWCLLPTVRRVLACEVRGTPYEHAFRRAFPKLDFLWLGCSSRDRTALTRVERWLSDSCILEGRSIDVLFIDGDKAHFENDFDAYLPHMSPAGVVFFHDIADRATGDAYLRVCSRGYRHEEIADKTDAEEAVAREEAGIPPESAHEGWLRHWRGASCQVGVIYLA